MSRVGVLPVIFLAALAGLAHAWSVALPWSGSGAWWLQIASLAALCALMDAVSSKWHAAAAAWTFGSAWLCGCFWWMHTSMHVYGGLPWPLAALAVMLLASALSLYLAIASLGFKTWSPTSPIQRALLFASCWLRCGVRGCTDCGRACDAAPGRAGRPRIWKFDVVAKAWQGESSS
jgi:apolipoprotein N-acyltransferase